MKIVLVGHGNVGKELRRVISENGLEVNLIVQKDGIYDTRGLRINEIDALRLFLNQERMQYVLEEVIRFKPNIRLGDDYVRSYAGCFLYTHYYNAANYESYPEETWACIFDPNEIKQFEYYEKIITYESTTIDLLNKLR